MNIKNRIKSIEEDLQKQAENIQKSIVQIAELKSDIEENTIENSGRWRAEENETYFVVGNAGDIAEIFESFSKFDNFHYKTRNYFETEKQAENYLKFLNIEADIRDIADKLNADNPVDWSDGEQKKYYMYFDYMNGHIERSHINQSRPISIYCTNKYFIARCLSKIGKNDLEFYLKYER